MDAAHISGWKKFISWTVDTDCLAQCRGSEVSKISFRPEKQNSETRGYKNKDELNCTRCEKILAEENGEYPLLVDTRSPMEFEGRLYDYQPRMGHIPRSVNIWFDRCALVNDGRFIGKENFSPLRI